MMGDPLERGEKIPARIAPRERWVGVETRASRRRVK
jgi:hypothetical protein